jgi:hypothetical protein
MNGYKGYSVVTLGDVPVAKLRKAAKTGKMSLTASELKGNRRMLMHPSNAKRVKSAQKKGMGVQGLELSEPEILNDIEYHSKMGAGMSAGSLWDTIKSVGSWLKTSGVGSVLADAAQAAATPFVGATTAQIGRDILKTTTGVGLTSDLKERMKKVRAARKGKKPLGGSFLIN